MASFKEIDAFGSGSSVFHSASSKVNSPGHSNNAEPWNEAMANTRGVTTGAHHFSGTSGYYGHWDPESGEPDPLNRFSSEGFFSPYDLLLPWGAGFTAVKAFKGLSKVKKLAPLIGTGIGMLKDLWSGDVSPTLRK